MKFILGKKLEMTQIFQADGRVIPVTAVLANPNVVTQIKTDEREKYSAVQIGFGGVGSKHIKKPQLGHLKGLDQAKEMKTVREFKIDNEATSKIKRGDKITVKVFENGDVVKVVGTSKGKGFQGVVKRHGFHGSPASHGHKDQLRMGGSIGATDAARVFKGMRMPGRMGDDRVSVSGLNIVSIDSEKNILYIKGAIPGARNGLVLVSAPGEMNIHKNTENTKTQKQEDIKVEEEKKEIEAPKEEKPVENKVEEKVEVVEKKVEENKAEVKEENPIEEKNEEKIEENK